mgnify:CR=1 FL=1
MSTNFEESTPTTTPTPDNTPAEVTAFNVLSQAFDLANRRGSYSLSDSALINQQLVVLRNFLVSHFSTTTTTNNVSQNVTESQLLN